MDNKTRILSLDGGTHGFTWLFCLREIERDNPGFLSQADVLVGSSFGGFCALYLARHLSSVPKGESALEIIDGCVAYMADILAFNPGQEEFARLLAGEQSMYTFERMNDVLVRDENLSDATLGDLARRVIIITLGTCNPSWAPTVYDSDDDAHKDKRASEAALEAAAFPVMLPLRNGVTNGSLGGPNGSVEALSRVASSDSSIDMENVVLFSLGCDAGTCVFGNFPTPWDAADAVPEQPSWREKLASLNLDEEALSLLEQNTGEVWEKLKDSLAVYADAEHTKANYGFEFMTQRDDATSETVGSTSWGWKPWLLYLPSPLFFYAVIIANQALQVSGQASQLLGERAFRLAPIAFLSSSQILILTFLPKGEHTHDAIIGVGRLTAALWADPATSELLQFTPNVAETEAYIDQHWMPQEAANERASAKARRSGWRLGKSIWASKNK